MAIKLYLDEDVDPLLARVLRDRGMDCISTYEAHNQGQSDINQLKFATNEGRTLLTFNIKDFVRLAQKFTASTRHHSGIIVSNHLLFRELLRRVLILLVSHPHEDMSDRLLWLQDYKEPPGSPPGV